MELPQAAFGRTASTHEDQFGTRQTGEHCICLLISILRCES